MNSSFRSLACFVFVLLAISLFATGGRHQHSMIIPIAKAETVESCPLRPTGFITWSPAEFECPICQTKNTFMVWGSYGSYIYQFPSKYQLVFWPLTDSQAWYSCKKCHYSTFMEDFKNVPKDKVAEIRKLLEGVTLPEQKGHDYEQNRQFAWYLGLAVSDRLKVVEKIDSLLGRNGDDHLSHFYRVLAYHLAAEKKQAEADEARRKALAITERMLIDKANDGRRRELLFISGAMRHFLRDDVGALKDFEQAKKLKYFDANLKEEDNKGYDDYLSQLIDEYVHLIQQGKGPKEEVGASLD